MTIRLSSVRALLLASFLGLATGCDPSPAGLDDLDAGPDDTPGGDTAAADTAKLVLSLADTTLYVGGSVRLSATYLDEKGNPVPGQAVTWSSADSTKVSVEATGVAHANYPGTVIVTATAGQKSASASIRVLPPSSNLQLLPERPVAIAGAPFRLFARAGGYGPRTREWRPGELRWASSDSTVARVDSTGVVEGLQEGTVTITVTVPPEAMEASVELAVVPGVAIDQVSAGGVHTCATTTTGEAVCWGSSDFAALGAQMAPEYCNQYGCKRGPARAPVPVGTASRFVSVAAGESYDLFAHTCGLTTADEVLCWGNNDQYQLGRERAETFSCTGGGSRSAPCSYTPQRAGVTGTVRAVASGDAFSCALSSTGEVDCWGLNGRGQAGLPAGQSRTLPSRLATDLRFVAVTLGARHACALDAEGRAFCWGDNGAGQLGIGPADPEAHPIPVHAAAERLFSAIAAGDDATCGVDASDGTAHCWGSDSRGLVRGAEASRAQGLSFRSIGVGAGHACALTESGQAYCWGGNAEGQLGTGAAPSDVAVATPTPVAGGHLWRTLGVGASHTCGVTTDGVAYCWGNNATGQLGIGSDEPALATPARVSGQR